MKCPLVSEPVVCRSVVVGWIVLDFDVCLSCVIANSAGVHPLCEFGCIGEGCVGWV